MRNLVLLAAFCAFAAFANPAQAQDSSAGSDPAYLGLAVGYYDIFDDDDAATDFRVDYTSGDAFFWKLKPFVGLEATTDGSIWAGGGVKADFKLAPNIYLDPSVGAGLYAQGGSDKDLGSVLEFRTQLEGGYEFTNGHRIGAYISHTSNAGIADDNPGTEVMGVEYHIPVGSMF